MLSRTTRMLTTVTVMVLLLAGGVHAKDDAEALKIFDDMFGKAYKGVKTTRSTADDAKLAAILLGKARETGGRDPLTVLLYERSYELGSTHTSGFKVATDALQELANIVPRRQLEMQENLLRLYEIVFRTSRGTSASAKARHERAGQATVELMVEIADGKTRRAQYMDAVRLLTKAYQIGRVVKSTQLTVIKEKLDKVKPMAVVGRKIDSATRALERDPSDKEAAKTLAELFIQELDRPVTPKRYAVIVYTKDQMDLLHWAGRPVHSLDADQSLKLAKWYAGLADGDVSSNAAVHMLVRARVYYEQYLSLKPDDAGAKLAFTKVRLSFAKHKVDGPTSDRLAKSRRDRLGIQVASNTKPNTTPTPRPQPKPNVKPNPKPNTPSTPRPTPKDPPATNPNTNPDSNPTQKVDMSFYEDDVEGEFAERKLDDAYWKTKKSIFDF